jgi:hypothetical protein
MPYGTRRGTRGRAAIACIGGLLNLWMMSGCSDSGNGPSESDGTGGAGGSDAGGTDAAFTDRAGKGGAMSDAPVLPWKPVPVPGTLCRDATTTGFAVNEHPTSRDLLIYLEGGGACFNDISCLQNRESWPPTDASITESMARNWILTRSSANSPFKDWNLVYIPYCSGDVHTGSALVGYMGQPQVGFVNYKLDLAEIIARFPNMDRVVLAGVSAGGFGVAWNWLSTQEAFGSVPVFALDDSGPPMGPDYLSECQQQRYGALWNWAGNFHPKCTSCDVAAGKVVRPLLDASFQVSTPARFGVLSYDEDGTIKTFFAYGMDNCANWDSMHLPAYPTGRFPSGLTELRQAWSGYPQVAMYVVTGGAHTFLESDIASVKTGAAIPMLEWIKKLIDKSDGWTNVAP